MFKIVLRTSNLLVNIVCVIIALLLKGGGIKSPRFTLNSRKVPLSKDEKLRFTRGRFQSLFHKTINLLHHSISFSQNLPVTKP